MPTTCSPMGGLKAYTRKKTKAWPRGMCLVTGDSMLSYIDETRMSKKFNIKVRSFTGAKTDDVSLLSVIIEEKSRLCHSACSY